MGTRQDSPNCNGTPIKKFTLKCFFLTWRRASENFDSYSKTLLAPVPGGRSYLIFLKLKLVFSFDQVKHKFSHFGCLKKLYKSFNLKFSFRQLFLRSIENICKFLELFHLKSFFENENFAACARCVRQQPN